MTDVYPQVPGQGGQKGKAKKKAGLRGQSKAGLALRALCSLCDTPPPPPPPSASRSRAEANTIILGRNTTR